MEKTSTGAASDDCKDIPTLSIYSQNCYLIPAAFTIGPFASAAARQQERALQIAAYVAGHDGGSLTFVYSLDYARTRLSNDLKGKDGGKREFNGLADVYRKTYAADGIAGLYRGFNISFVGIFIYRGLYFGMYDSAKAIMPEDTGVTVKFLVGYAVTVLSGLASYPIDTIRRRMMMTSGSKEVQYKNSFDATKQIFQQEGAMSFMKGAGANILRGVAGAGVLSGFDVLKTAYTDWKFGN